jgi:hypothetical protein
VAAAPWRTTGTIEHSVSARTGSSAVSRATAVACSMASGGGTGWPIGAGRSSSAG